MEPHLDQVVYGGCGRPHALLFSHTDTPPSRCASAAPVCAKARKQGTLRHTQGKRPVRFCRMRRYAALNWTFLASNTVARLGPFIYYIVEERLCITTVSRSSARPPGIRYACRVGADIEPGMEYRGGLIPPYRSTFIASSTQRTPGGRADDLDSARARDHTACWFVNPGGQLRARGRPCRDVRRNQPDADAVLCAALGACLWTLQGRCLPLSF